jgi:carbamoyltransferase
MNSLANGKILANTPFEELFISPAPADNGCCIGGPLWILGTAGQQAASFRTSIPAYTGPAFDALQIEETLRRYKLPYRRSESVTRDTVGLIERGDIVGWFQGRMEFGERALGNRSILADPRDAAMKDKINRSVKYREAYRPFAPSVTTEAAPAWFDLPPHADSRFMEQVYPVRAEKRAAVPAIVHRDGTGRLQTVHRQDNPEFHALLRAFEESTGVPMLLNTSFNINGEPIVATPEDALRTFFTSGLDSLVMGPFILEKRRGLA